MKLIVKLASENTSKIEIISSPSKDIPVKFSNQFIHILNNK